MKLSGLAPNSQLVKTIKILRHQNSDDPPAQPCQTQLAKSLKTLRKKK